ncbi:hypothetical protein BJV77DRAFT_1011414 [Russula vinacea]|nr:hypothetical protein BJV77DRAFT_1026859 [Russula vinacea]KAH9990796.1 hypothetical protein BJV77DRAFT_1011414 [Russula vinacea]
MRKRARLVARLASALLVWSEDQPSTSLPPRTAPARGLHTSTPTCFSYRSPPLQSYKTCQDVHNRSRAGLPPHPLQSRAPHSNRSPDRGTLPRPWQFGTDVHHTPAASQIKFRSVQRCARLFALSISSPTI